MTSVTPNFGPESGLTKVTIQGGYFGDQKVAVQGILGDFREYWNPICVEAYYPFYPTALKGCRVLFPPMVSGWAGGGKKFVRAVSQKP